MLKSVDMPQLGPTMETGKVVRWIKTEGDKVDKGEILFEVETDKANVEVESYESGVLRKIIVGENIEVPVNTPIALIADSMSEDISSFAGADGGAGEEPAAEAGPEPAKKPAPKAAEAPGKRKIVKISPLARRMAQENNLEIEGITGTGPGGRITKEDVEKALTGKTVAEAEVPDEPAAEEPFEDVVLTKMRQVIAQRLSESKQTAPHFYIDITADATALTEMRAELVKKADTLGVKITFNDILIKLVAQALKEFPGVNASFQSDTIRMHKAVNIGVAVGVEDGLVVPVVKNVDTKSISRIAKDVRELAEKAHGKKLLPSDYAGGTFTISNLGMYGVDSFHAIINPPESAILAAAAIIPRPMVIDGEVVVRPSMKISMSVDHRVIDGVLAAKFLGRVKELIEAPYLLIV